MKLLIMEIGMLLEIRRNKKMNERRKAGLPPKYKF